LVVVTATVEAACVVVAATDTTAVVEDAVTEEQKQYMNPVEYPLTVKQSKPITLDPNAELHSERVALQVSRPKHFTPAVY
jgi:hypothetical protein